MKNIIFLTFLTILIFSNTLLAHPGRFDILEDLSEVPEPQVTRKMKNAATKILMGGTLVVFSPYVPHLGGGTSRPYFGRTSGAPYDYDLVSPTTIKLMGNGLCLHGLREFLSAANEKYNILRGSRNPANSQPDFLREIKNGFMDIGLGCFIYVAHHHIPTFLMEPYIELAGPAVTVVTISCLCIRGLTGLTTAVPGWLEELDWTSTTKSLWNKTCSVLSSAASWVGSFFQRKDEPKIQ